MNDQVVLRETVVVVATVVVMAAEIETIVAAVKAKVAVKTKTDQTDSIPAVLVVSNLKVTIKTGHNTTKVKVGVGVQITAVVGANIQEIANKDHVMETEIKGQEKISISGLSHKLLQPNRQSLKRLNLNLWAG